MTSATQLSIVNRALLGIGSRTQISSFAENSPQAQAASVLFTPTFEQLARAAHWNCLRKQAVLTLLQAATGTPENPNGTTLPLPPTPWLYAYQVPSDSLKIRTIVPSLPSLGVGTPVTGGSLPSPICLPLREGLIPFAVAYSTDNTGSPINVILTNQSQAQAIYTVNQPNPSIWDSQFQAAMVAGLGAFFVPALSMNLPLMQAAVKMAESVIAAARTSDGLEGTTSQDNIPDWIRARRSGGGVYGYTGNNNYCFGGYENVCWPC